MLGRFQRLGLPPGVQERTRFIGDYPRSKCPAVRNVNGPSGLKFTAPVIPASWTVAGLEPSSCRGRRGGWRKGRGGQVAAGIAASPDTHSSEAGEVEAGCSSFPALSRSPSHPHPQKGDLLGPENTHKTSAGHFSSRLPASLSINSAPYWPVGCKSRRFWGSWGTRW